MDARVIIQDINSYLKSAVKVVAIGDYAGLLQNATPLAHELNNKGHKIAFTNCNIFDGINPDLKEDMAVLVEADRIRDVRHGKHITVPDDCFVVDLEGHTLMPGLIDSHVHECSPFTYDANAAAVRQMPRQVILNNIRTVCSGVTTICDMGGPQGIIKEFSRYSHNNTIPGPRYLNCFTLISPRKGKKLGYPSQVKLLNPIRAWILEGQVAMRPKTQKALKKACRKIIDDGAVHIKTTYQPHPFSKKKYATQNEFPLFDDDWLRSILKMGKEAGLVVDIHSPYAAAAEKCVDLAIDVGARIRIQHMTFDTDLKDTMIRKMCDHGFYMIPTVMIYGDSFHMPDFISWLNTNPAKHMMPEANRQIRLRIENGIALEPFSGKVVMEHDYAFFREQFDCVRRNTQKAHDSGIIGFGTDMGGTNTGFFGRIFSEIDYYNDFGICAFDILKYLTSTNAEINGLNDRGVIKAGKLADLITVDGNPLQDIRVLSDVSSVIKGGIFLKHKGIDLTTPSFYSSLFPS